jgi:NAD(P)-dependent dehydrogenase (short-subunit alcohol dehydrogenase family)
MARIASTLAGIALWVTLAAPSLAADAEVAAAPPAAPVALITGYDRGIGLALTREFVSRGWRVIATCRDPARATELKELATGHPGVTIERLDVADNAAIDALSARLREQPIDALINNAGVIGDFDAQRFSTLAPDEFQRVMRINTYAPLRVAQAFMPQVEASRQKKIVSISSGIGSLARAPDSMQNAPAYYYAISKAGLNMAMRMLATEARPRGVLVGLVTPGRVETDMQVQYRAASAAVAKAITAPALSPADSARALVDFVVALDSEKSGRVFNHAGAEIPW